MKEAWKYPRHFWEMDADKLISYVFPCYIPARKVQWYRELAWEFITSELTE